MNKPKKTDTKRTPLDAQIRQMIRESGMTLNAVAVAAGVPQPVLYRFLNGGQATISLETAERLCAFFDVRLTAPRKHKPAMKGK